jgi:hypothetical protein
MNWSVPRIWEGGDVWILGGGPSLPKQFEIPQEVIDGVISKALPLSAYSTYMESIHKKHIIGINMAYKIGNWIDMMFFGDTNYFIKNKDDIFLFPGLKVSCTPSTIRYEWVKTLNREMPKPYGISTKPNSVSWNTNSGAASISVAVNAGAKRIFLLGFDMKLDGNIQHWHSLYNEKALPKNKVRLPFDRHLKSFPTIANDAKNLGIQIYNICPNSAINNFPKITLQEALQL